MYSQTNESGATVGGAEGQQAPSVETACPTAPGRRQSRSWLLAGISLRTLMHLRVHKQVEEFLKLPPFVDIVQENPKFAFKYLTESYLANDLSITERAACFLHNYRRLYETLPDRPLRQMLHWGIDVCEFCQKDIRFTLRWGSSRPFGKEGELSLVLLAKGEIIFTIAFTIVPGYIVRSKQDEVILISRIQGTAGWPIEKIRQVQRALNAARFGVVVFSGLEGLASALKISEIACVVPKKQISYSEAYADRFEHAYDSLFADLRIPKTEAGFFVASLPLEDKSIDEVKRQKARWRARQALRKQVLQSCAEAVAAVLQEKADPGSCAVTAEGCNDDYSSPSMEEQPSVLERDESSLSFG